MANRLFFHLISGITGILIAIELVGIGFDRGNKELFITGVFIGAVNFFIKPVLKIIFLPLRILTLGTFSLVINLILIWVTLSLIFKNWFDVESFFQVILLTFVISFLNFLFNLKK